MALPACPAAFPCLAGGTLQNVPSGLDFASPFSSLDLRLKKDIRLGEGATLSLMGSKGLSTFNETKYSRGDQHELLRDATFPSAVPAGAERSARAGRQAIFLLTS